MRKKSGVKQAFYAVDSLLRMAYSRYVESGNELILDNAELEARQEIFCHGLYEKDEEKLLNFFCL